LGGERRRIYLMCFGQGSSGGGNPLMLLQQLFQLLSMVQGGNGWANSGAILGGPPGTSGTWNEQPTPAIGAPQAQPPAGAPQAQQPGAPAPANSNSSGTPGLPDAQTWAAGTPPAPQYVTTPYQPFAPPSSATPQSAM
jgi:hypothetical protein